MVFKASGPWVCLWYASCTVPVAFVFWRSTSQTGAAAVYCCHVQPGQTSNWAKGRPGTLSPANIAETRPTQISAARKCSKPIRCSEVSIADKPQVAGSKAASSGKLEKLAQQLGFKAPKGLAIPFGVMKAGRRAEARAGGGTDLGRPLGLCLG